jgi:hypothetical protein
MCSCQIPERVQTPAQITGLSSRTKGWCGAVAKLKWTTWEDLHYNLPDEVETKIGYNTTAYLHPLGKVDIRLHGHKIVSLEHRYVEFSMCGYPTCTTRERINQFLRPFGASVHQHKWMQELVIHSPKQHSSLYIAPVYDIITGAALEPLVPGIPCWAIEAHVKYSLAEFPTTAAAEWEVTSMDELLLHDDKAPLVVTEVDLWPLGKE